MKTFAAFYIGTAEAWEKEADAKADTADRDARGMAAWGQWMMDNQDIITDPGAPLGKTLRVSKSGVEPFVNTLAGYVIVQAESHEAAAKLFENHPHFAIFPGDSVEVVEIMPLPAG